jgi:hypothetical protein
MIECGEKINRILVTKEKRPGILASLRFDSRLS